MLLSTAKNPPNKSGELLTTRDLICVFFSLKTNWSMFYINGDIIAVKSLEEFKTELQGIADDIAEKDRAGKGLRAVVFINDLDVLRSILPDGQEQNARRKKNDVTYTLEFVTERLVFRNFNVIFNRRAQAVKKIFPDIPICQGMAKFIKSLGLPLKYCRYSLAYVSKRKFYEDIKADLWEDTKEHRRILRDVQTYKDMQCGNQGGALSSFEGSGDVRFEILRGVISYDKKSAYPSYFVQDKFFPIGRIDRIVGNVQYRIGILRGLIRRRSWFKIVAESAEEIPAFKLFRDVSYKERYVYGIEFWDYHTMRDAGLDMFAPLTADGVKFRLYGTRETGYMPDCFRRKIVQLYDQKNALPKNSAEKFLKKTQLDMIYGKGLQKYEFADDQSVFKKYVMRGENFLTPAMSMHVVSGMRHEILKIAWHFAALGELIALDTDGVKTDGDEAATKEFFEMMNDYIRQKNRDAGFDSDVGIWDHEYTAEKFMQFAPKVYAYSACGETVCKFAGIQERHLKKYIRSIDGDPFEVWAREGIHAQTCGGWYYIPDVGFLEKVVPFVIDREVSEDAGTDD